MKVKLVLPTDIIGVSIQDETFVFSYDIGKGFIKRNIDMLNLQIPTFENIVQKIESMSLTELKTFNLDSVLFNNGSIFVSNKITKEINLELDLIPIGTHHTFVDTLISEKKAKSRYFDILEATVVKETLTNANFISNTNISILENIAVGTLVSPNMILIDIPNYNYELLNYVDTFEFVGGKIKTKANIDYETRINYDLQLKIVDKVDATKFWLDTVHVDVVNVPDSLVIGALRTSNVAENSVNGTIAIDINNLITKEAGLNTSLSLNNYTDKFAISGNNLIVNGVLDYETATQYIVSVKITNTDDVSMFWNTDITINIDNVADTITISQTRVANVDENSVVGTVVTDLTTMFTKEANLTTSFEVLTNSDKFAISGNNLTVNGVLDFETTPQYVVSVKIINTATPTMFWTMDITVNINNLVEVVTPPAGSSIVISCSNIPQNGLMASYLLQGTAESATGNYNGTETNMTYTYDNTRGIVGSFNNTSKYIVTGYPSLTKDGISICMWFKYSGTGILTSHLMGSKTYVTNNALFIGNHVSTDNNIDFQIRNGTIYNLRVSSSTHLDGKWHNMIVTYNGTTFKSYLDGSYVAAMDLTLTNNLGDNLEIGGYGAGAEAWSGNISNTHIYNRAITAEEVTTIYNIEKFNHTNPIDQGLVAYYPLNGNALDYSVSGYDGTATNVTYTNGINGNVAATFNDTSYITNASVNTNIMTLNTSSITMWFNVGTKATNQELLSFYEGTVSSCGITVLPSGLLEFRVYAGAYVYLRTTFSVANNQWNFFTLTRNGTSWSMYFNNVIVGTVTSGITADTYKFTIGKNVGLASYGVTGQIANVRFYNRVLSDREIGLINEMERPHASCPIKALVNNPDPFGDKSGVALYKFDGDVTDVTGTYNGTATNITYVDGKFGKAAVFNGTAKVLSPKIVTNDAQSFTASLWVKPSSTAYAGANNMALLSYDQDEWYIIFVGSAITFYCKSGNFVTGTVSYNTSRTDWFLITAVCEMNNKLSLYIDGGLVGTTPFPYSRRNNNILNCPGTGIGYNTYPGQPQYFNGSIDQVRIFNRAINADEVKTLYRESSMIYDTDKVDLLGDGSCKALYKFEGNANDESSNYNGTATNVTYGAGKFGTGGDFNGATSKIVLPTSLPKFRNTADTPISFSFWAKGGTQNTFTDGAVYDNLLKYDGFSFGISPTVSKAYLLAPDSVNCSSATELNLRLSDTTFSHYVIVADMNTRMVKSYQDGILKSSIVFPLSGTYLDNNTARTIGTASNSRFFKGLIDQVRIFNKALTQAEVTTLFNESNTIIAPKNNLDLFNDSSIKALYKFDGNSNDDTGTYNGTPYNITYGTGKLNKAAIFNGTNSYIQTQYKAPASSQYTYSAWMKSTKILGSNESAYIIGDYNSVGANASGRAMLGFWGTNFSLNMGNNSVSSWHQNVGSALPVLDGNWHNLVLVVNGFSQKLYVDGSLYASITTSISAGTAGGINVTIGRGGDWSGNAYFTGSIDHVRIYNKALNQQEINYLYNEVATNYNTDRLDFFNDGSGKALYKFDGTANDESGLYNGIPTNVTYANGKFDKCAVFNGVNGTSVDLPSSLFSTNPTAFTLSLWLNPKTITTGQHLPIWKLNRFGLNLSTDTSVNSNANKLTFAIANSSAEWVKISSNDNIIANQWIHATATWDGSIMKLYINGILQNVTATTNMNTSMTTYNQCIGNANNNGSRIYPFDGSIDQVRIFSKALTQAEITLLFNETK